MRFSYQEELSMSTDKQIAANRANALKSTGPRTASGKARAARNAFTLGLATHQLLAPSESRATLARHAAELRAHFSPATSIEALLVDRLIAASWRLRRARIIEARIYHQRAKKLSAYSGNKPHKHDSLADIFRHTHDEKSMLRLSLDEVRLERSLYRALKELNAEKDRHKRENKNGQIEPNSNFTQPHESPAVPRKIPPAARTRLKPIQQAQGRRDPSNDRRMRRRIPAPSSVVPAASVSATLSQEPQSA